MLRIRCPGCGWSAEVLPELAGLTVHCKGCEKPLTVPGESEPTKPRLRGAHKWAIGVGSAACLLLLVGLLGDDEQEPSTGPASYQQQAPRPSERSVRASASPDAEARANPPATPLYVVSRVIDGDTILLANGERVRYIGIDTPETKHPRKPVEAFGPEASEYNERLVKGRQVRLELDVQQRDKYGRLLAYVWVGDTFVNAELVRAGYAQVATYPPNVKYQDRFLLLQREAREAGRGLWGGTVVSTSGRAGTRTSQQRPATTSGQTVYVTRTGRKYHAAGCRYLRSSAIPILFDDAVRRGKTPCSVCGPPRASGSTSSVAPRRSSPPARQENGGGGTVYATRTGKKYHRGSCSYLRSSRIPIQKNDAVRRGLGPCSRCRP